MLATFFSLSSIKTVLNFKGNISQLCSSWLVLCAQQLCKSRMTGMVLGAEFCWGFFGWCFVFNLFQNSWTLAHTCC